AFRPVIYAGEYRVLIVEIVVEHGHQRSAEAHVLFEWARALHLERDLGDAIGEKNVRAIGFVSVRNPFVADRRAIGLKRKRAGDLRRSRIGYLDVGRAASGPAATGGRDFELFVADRSAFQLNREFSLVLCEYGRAGRWR